jgi:hypothetical protein
MSGYRRFYTKAQLEEAWQANELSALKERLLSNYTEHDGGYATPCWMWLGTITSDGYGRLSVNDCGRPAHRYSWLCHFGDIPQNMNVCHHCDNPWCIRPDHLFLGTDQDNVDDMRAKGRDTYGQNYGKNNGQSRLTDEQVLEIRRKCAAGGLSHEKIARQYHIDRKTVAHINSGRNWIHLLPDDYVPAPAQPPPRGEAQGRSKLTEDQARQIRRMALSGDYCLQEIADMFNISKSGVHAIKSGRNWRHLWQSDELPSIDAASSTANVE